MARAARFRRRQTVVGLAMLAFGAGAALGACRPEGASNRAGAVTVLDDSKLAGQRFVAGFPGTAVPTPVRTMIREGQLAGVILFAGNIPSRAAGRRLIGDLQRIPRPGGLRDPLLIMIDQEGGLVKRVGGAPAASAEEMGARGPRYARRQGARTAVNLTDLGANVNLAPVLDVARPGGTIDDDDRGFGSTAAAVSRTAIPFAAALGKGGVAATAKHFPGLGSASENTDFSSQTINLSKAALRRVDEAPYERFVDVGGDLVMMSSAIYPAFSGKPAVFTRAVATGELRGRLGFRGVSITDALGGAAVQAFGGPKQASVAAAGAGVDLLLFSDYQSAASARRALRRKLSDGSLDRGLFERSVARVLTLRRELRPGG